METYQIEIENRIHNVIAQDEITYLIQTKGMKDFVLCRETKETGNTWKVTEGMALVVLVNALGLAIEYAEKLNVV